MALLACKLGRAFGRACAQLHHEYCLGVFGMQACSREQKDGGVRHFRRGRDRGRRFQSAAHVFDGRTIWME